MRVILDIETNESAINYELNMPVTVEIKDSNGDWVFLFIFSQYLLQCILNPIEFQ